jgi:hypothetical protein
MRIIQGIKPEIKPQRIYQLLGYNGNPILSRNIKNRVMENIYLSHEILKPEALYTERGIKEICDDTLILNDDMKFKSNGLIHAVRKCQKVIVFLVTIGKKLDWKIDKLMNEKRLTEAYLLDSIGSVAVEEAAAGLQRVIDEDLQNQFKKTSLRFSPGYCDWKLQEQKMIFNILDADLVGVKLSPSYLMSPRKSISGIFGIGNEKDMKYYKTNPCYFCELKNCIARRR